MYNLSEHYWFKFSCYRALINKTLIKLIKKKVEDKPIRWHEVLSEALWAHHISRHGATKEVDMIIDNTDEVTDKRIQALKKIERDKA